MVATLKPTIPHPTPHTPHPTPHNPHPDPSPVPRSGVWTHIAASYDTVGGSKLFVNGTLVDYRAAPPGTYAIDFTFANRFRIGIGHSISMRYRSRPPPSFAT